MNKVGKYSLIILVIVLVLITTACNQKPDVEDIKENEEETVKIVFSEKVLDIAKMSPDEWVTDLINTSDGNYVDVYVNDDEASVTLEIKEEQRNFWIQSRENLMTKLKTKFSQLNPKYKIEYSDDYSHIDMYYDLNLDAYDAIYYVLYTEVICISEQLFNGVGSEGWFVSFNIYNSNTGKFVASGDSNTGLSYREEDWEASM